MVWMDPPWSLSATSNYNNPRLGCFAVDVVSVRYAAFLKIKSNVIPSIKPEPMVKRQSYWSRKLYLNQHLMLLELETD
jgi:hypothetical protein